MIQEVKAARGQPHRRSHRSTPTISNPETSYERNVLLARNAALSGDTIATENFYQHADHYFRLMREQQA